MFWPALSQRSDLTYFTKLYPSHKYIKSAHFCLWYDLSFSKKHPAFLSSHFSLLSSPPIFAAMRKIKPFTAKMELIDAASDGRAVARHEGRAIFVEGGVPGDIADVHVFRVQKKLPIGKIVSLESPSEHRTEPKCKHFEDCSGCKWQHMKYEAQIHFKEKQVVDILTRVGKVEIGEALPILGVEGEPYEYRNKLEFSFQSTYLAHAFGYPKRGRD